MIIAQELVSLMNYVEKMITSTAETAFLAGAEQSSTLMCERLNSALEKVFSVFSVVLLQTLQLPNSTQLLMYRLEKNVLLIRVLKMNC